MLLGPQTALWKGTCDAEWDLLLPVLMCQPWEFATGPSSPSQSLNDRCHWSRASWKTLSLKDSHPPWISVGPTTHLCDLCDMYVLCAYECVLAYADVCGGQSLMLVCAPLLISMTSHLSWYFLCQWDWLLVSSPVCSTAPHNTGVTCACYHIRLLHGCWGCKLRSCVYPVL